MRTRQTILPLLPFLLSLIACGPNEDRIRQMIAEAFAANATITTITEGETIGPYSPAVRAGNLVFLSGQIGLDPATGTFAGDDIEAQTRQALTNLSRVLHQAGLDSSNVVQCNVFLTDMNAFQRMNLIYGGYFPEDRYPARTTVEVRSLPRGALIEIAAIAFETK
jgi:2-iminobutanoate/2-iminopropanoate deaminase